MWRRDVAGGGTRGGGSSRRGGCRICLEPPRTSAEVGGNWVNQLGVYFRCSYLSAHLPTHTPILPFSLLTKKKKKKKNPSPFRSSLTVRRTAIDSTGDPSRIETSAPRFVPYLLPLLAPPFDSRAWRTARTMMCPN